jgi:hypothetical protein
MSKKKAPPRLEAEKDFVSRSSPLSVSVPLDSLERLGSGWPFPWVSSSGGDHATRVLNLCGVRQWYVMHSLGVSKRKGLRALRLLLIYRSFCARRSVPGVLCPAFSGSRADRSLPSSRAHADDTSRDPAARMTGTDPLWKHRTQRIRCCRS